jgi:hypothetical protein
VIPITIIVSVSTRSWLLSRNYNLKSLPTQPYVSPPSPSFPYLNSLLPPATPPSSLDIHLPPLDGHLPSVDADVQTAQVAAQQGKYLAKMYGTLAKRIDTLDANEMPDHDDEMYYKPFKYLHLGTLAYIGNSCVLFFPLPPSFHYLFFPFHPTRVIPTTRLIESLFVLVL